MPSLRSAKTQTDTQIRASLDPCNDENGVCGLALPTFLHHRLSQASFAKTGR